MRHQFVRFLGSGIETDRMIDIVVDRKRQMRVGAIDRTRGREDKMFGVTMTAAFEDIEKPREIGIKISMRILQRITNAGLRREMNDRSELGLPKNPFDIPPLGEIDLVESEFGELT